MERQAILTTIVLLSVILLLPLISLAQSRQSNERAAEQTSTQSDVKPKAAEQPRKATPAPKMEVQKVPEVKLKPAVQTPVETAAPKPEVKTIPEVPKRTVTAPAYKINQLESLKVKRVYAKNNNLHVVLQYLGREKLSPQDLLRAELIIRHGAKTDVVSLRNKMTQLQQLGIPGRTVDVNTGIKPQNEMVKVSIKGQRDTSTTKIVIKHTGPLEVPKKEMAVGSMPAEEIDKVHTLKGLPGVNLNPNSPLWEISLDKVEVQTPHCSVAGSWYDLNKKYGPSCNDPNTVIYDHLKNKNEAIFVDVSSAFNEGSAFWFKVRAHIKIKSIPMDQMTDGQLAKWGEKAVGKWSLVVKVPFDGYLSKSKTISTPTITRESIQDRIEKNMKLEYELTSTLEIENTFLVSNFHQAVEGNDAFRTQVVVIMDPTYAIDEIDEDNNRTRVPELVLKATEHDEPKWHINLFRPDGSNKSNKWVIGSMQQIQWGESYVDRDSFIVIKLVRTGKGVSQVVGTIANTIYPSSSPASGTFSEGYNRFDWRAGQLLSGKYVEPNDKDDYYWLKFFVNDGGSLQPLVVSNDARFDLFNFTKQFGNQPKKETMQTPDSMITPQPQ